MPSLRAIYNSNVPAQLEHRTIEIIAMFYCMRDVTMLLLDLCVLEVSFQKAGTDARYVIKRPSIAYKTLSSTSKINASLATPCIMKIFADLSLYKNCPGGHASHMPAQLECDGQLAVHVDFEQLDNGVWVLRDSKSNSKISASFAQTQNAR